MTGTPNPATLTLNAQVSNVNSGVPRISVTGTANLNLLANNTMTAGNLSLADTATLNKQGPGALILTGTRAGGGLMNVAAGTVTGDSNSMAAKVNNSTSVIFNQTFDGTYTGALSGAGVYKKTGANVLTTPAANGNNSWELAGGTLKLAYAAPITAVDINESPGSFTNNGGGSYTVVAHGNDIWGNNDGLLYAYVPQTGDFSVSVRVASFNSTNGDGWSKAGIMVRNSTSSSSAADIVCVSQSNGTQNQIRYTDNTGMGYNLGGGGFSYPEFLRLDRVGNQFIAYQSPDLNNDGIPDGWTQFDSQTIAGFNSSLLLGLGVTAHNDGQTGTAIFDHVSFFLPGTADLSASKFAVTDNSTLQLDTAQPTNIGNVDISDTKTLTMAGSPNVTMNNLTLHGTAQLTGPAGGVFAATGTVCGTGTVNNPLTLRATGTIKPGTLTTTGTLHLSDLALDAQATTPYPTLSFIENAPATPTTAQDGDILYTGALSLLNDPTTKAQIGLSGTLAFGNYLLVDYAPGSTVDLTRFIVNGPPINGYTLSNGNSSLIGYDGDGSQIWVTVGVNEPGWTGASDAKWSNTAGNWAGTVHTTGAAPPPTSATCRPTLR